MKKKVTQTSIDAYRNLDLTRQQQEIIAILRIVGESCIADLARHLGWEKSTVSPRLNELDKMGLLVFAGKQKSKSTGIMSEFYRLKEKPSELF